ncbi:hypothetical protein GGI25_002824 [Coemansia spiralis]|uniref:PWWP domain-containing protein n=2 Tax=Coemansia TaxID=4863 RepID=A0A9W8G9T4_9FUNG|nr:hypothetical protein BX070DRAFT_225163 [Coemansia spiralis]KAJ1989055.1 hypothetical protein EDC05_004919 [Coemansia umbellata]KAJ2622329.1 hypothetical protein GGI26_003340 [Coemansia sp. RSA 1358]KAJ2677872.1 hypothetical protein GGI25_002824 [Coemansia spiralis]
MVLSLYDPGTLCWAKLKGYPWWPSRIEHEKDLSNEVLVSKPRNGRVYPVLFFGSLDYAWITPENLEPYEENLAKYGSKAKNRKDPTFADALKQAQDPAVAEEIIKRSLASASTSDNDDEDSNNEDDDDVAMHSAESDTGYNAKRKPAAKKEQRNGRGRKATVSNKRASISNDSSSDDAAVSTTPKRSRTAAQASSVSPDATPISSAKREGMKPQFDARESPRSGTPSTHHSPEHPGHKPGHSPSKDDARSEQSGKGHQHGKSRNKLYNVLMQIRHRLQKTVIKGNAPDDLAPVDELFRKLEEFDMTLELIQETKLGKVMRIIAGSDKIGDAPEEKYDIKGRARRLAEKWRRLITKLREGSAEIATPESPVSRPLESDNRVKDSDASHSSIAPMNNTSSAAGTSLGRSESATAVPLASEATTSTASPLKEQRPAEIEVELAKAETTREANKEEPSPPVSLDSSNTTAAVSNGNAMGDPSANGTGVDAHLSDQKQ